jgi:hypothetical protein
MPLMSLALKIRLGKEGSWPENHGFDFNLGGHSFLKW